LNLPFSYAPGPLSQRIPIQIRVEYKMDFVAIWKKDMGVIIRDLKEKDRRKKIYYIL
jgi:hypothetical protein